MTDFLLNPFRCYGSMLSAATLAGMVMAGEFPHGGDKRAHCLAFCELTKGCGPFWGGFVLTAGVGFSKEAFDTFCFYSIRPELGGHFNVNVPCYSPWDPKDLDANFWGAATCPGESCAKRSSAIPKDY